MGIYVKFTQTTHQIWSCHVTQASDLENFYFLPNSILNFRKVTKFGGNWLKNKKVTGKKQVGGWKDPPPTAYRVNRPVQRIYPLEIDSICDDSIASADKKKDSNHRPR